MTLPERRLAHFQWWMPNNPARQSARVPSRAQLCPSLLPPPIKLKATAARIDQMQGIWYLVATTEPTTRFCLCNVMNYSIYTSVYR